MSDQPEQERYRLKYLIAIVSLCLSFVLFAVYLFFSAQAGPIEADQVSQFEPRQGANSSFADVLQTIEEIGFEEIKTEQIELDQPSRCIESELGIPIVIHDHWQSADGTAIPNMFDGFYMHDLFYRGQCPGRLPNTLEFNR